SICTSSVGYVCLLAALVCACSTKPTPLAKLTRGKGVERQAGSGDSMPASPGAEFFVGDAASTRKDGSATLEIVGAGGAQLQMQPSTVLRFTRGRISVASGAVELDGVGTYALDVTDLTISKRGGKVRVTTSTVELMIGEAKVRGANGTTELRLQEPLDLARLSTIPLDAGVGDARAVPVDAAIDAAPDAPGDAGDTSGDATIEVTGPRAEILAPGQSAWTPLPQGAGQLARGSTVRLGRGTTARLVASGTTLALAGGARARLGEDLGLAVELGVAEARSPAPATIALPGGAVALGGSPHGPAEAKIDSNARDTKVTMLRAGSRLTGAAGAELAMSRGESALLTRSGAIRVLEAIPSYFDLRVVAGESLTIHDPRPPTSVQFQFDGKCPDGGIIEIDRDSRFRTPKVTSGRDFANLLVTRGSWAYRLRCTTNGAEGGAAASGRISAIRDDGHRPLPKNQGVNDIDADGRNYRISYQSAIPNVVVHVKNPGVLHRLHLASAGKEQTFDSSTPAITVPGAQLHEGTYTYWIDRDGVRQDKVSTLIIDFDQTAPQVYIESPANGQPWTGDIDVRGAVLPGWSAAVEAIAIPIDRQRRFAAKVGIPGSAALAIRLSHPQRGVHYYLRRPK
ncbi:MAG TPA: hypothetical protein VFT22_00105, partial [Kofleriaceae bacterium]|nr:hypothetical protein [Kofleriaceae bacterium]